MNTSKKGKVVLFTGLQASLWIGPDKIDPITKCISDSIDEIINTNKTCKYIFKFLLLFFRRNDRGIKKIKGKISCMSELFKPIINRKK